ncbi:MAG: class I SAM-dependent methyltransferase [Cyanobacteria bacterium SZAS LIN-2]|nr:class I SAM-dependent methyltransferase [Cyanobacteria bacterium SZAS LIN-2]
MTQIAPLKVEDVCCGVCLASEGENFASGKDFEYDTTGDTFNMRRCGRCSTVYLCPRPTVEELERIYPPNYYSYNYATRINPLAVKAKDFLDASKSKKWLSYVKVKEPRFLDVGCGNGRNLAIMHKLGVPREKLWGVEVSREVIARLKAEGYNGVYGMIENAAAELPQGSFDLIVILQVLEHVSDPRAVMACLAGLLAPGGVLVIETPNTASLDASLFKKRYWGGYHFPRHWNLFHTESLKRLADDFNLEVRAINFLPAQTFWIYSLHNLVKDKFQCDWLTRLFDPFQNLLLLVLFTSFDIVRARLGFKTSNVQMILTARE